MKKIRKEIKEKCMKSHRGRSALKGAECIWEVCILDGKT